MITGLCLDFTTESRTHTFLIKRTRHGGMEISTERRQDLTALERLMTIKRQIAPNWLGPIVEKDQRSVVPSVEPQPKCYAAYLSEELLGKVLEGLVYLTGKQSERAASNSGEIKRRRVPGRWWTGQTVSGPSGSGPTTPDPSRTTRP